METHFVFWLSTVNAGVTLALSAWLFRAICDIDEMKQKISVLEKEVEEAEEVDA